jgi:Recombination endonuclease VII
MSLTKEESALRAWAARLLRVFGITPDDYYDLLGYQGGNCWFCPADKQHSVRLAVDHSHKHGHIRGIVCSYHNRYVIGRHEDPALLRKVADYIENSPAEHLWGGRRIVPGFGVRKKRKRRPGKVP